MRKLLVAVLLAGAASVFWAAGAKAGCGPGCHMTLEGACVVDGWGRIRNECPVPSRPVRPCPYGTRWAHGACMPLN